MIAPCGRHGHPDEILAQRGGLVEASDKDQLNAPVLFGALGSISPPLPMLTSN